MAHTTHLLWTTTENCTYCNTTVATRADDAGNEVAADDRHRAMRERESVCVERCER
jgi:hypothetical protein